MRNDIDMKPLAFLIDELRRGMTGDPKWLLSSWGAYQPPSDHIVYADLVDAEKRIVATRRLNQWAQRLYLPLVRRLTVLVSDDVISPSITRREFDQWGAYATIDGLTADRMGFSWPLAPTHHLTLLRYVERL